MDCAILVVTHNSADDVVGLLESIPAAAGGLSVRTVVVDNGSSDGTLALLRKREEILLIETGANLGYAGGINVGRRFAGPSDALLVLNPDLRLEPGSIDSLARALDDPRVGIAVPIILGSDGRSEPSLRREPSLTRALGDALFGRRFASRPGWLSEMVWDRDAYDRPHTVDWATGAAAMISAACDAAVGDWDARFFLYSEEVDHAARARDAGFRIEFVPAARVRHRAGGSGSSDALVALLAVNRIRYMEKRGSNTGAYRITVALHELLRASNPGHRLALKMVLRRSSWASLPSATLPEPLRDEDDGGEWTHSRQVTVLPSQGWSNP